MLSNFFGTAALYALQILQDGYFQVWLGQYPTSIDWTGAVTATHVVGMLDSLSQGLKLNKTITITEYQAMENLVTGYFSQITAYYFGQDQFAIRNEAYDDMLWVVLGWLDTIRFIDRHTALNYQVGDTGKPGSDQIPHTTWNQSWHGNIWTTAFSHRARVFWELAAKGWDEKYCGGGMTWNPRLEPYKNAITNELFISASVAMYLYFPGDDNTSPFNAPPGMDLHHGENLTTIAGWKARDPRFLDIAIRAYDWLQHSGMTNWQGLYVDGFHISGYNNPSHSNNTKCDDRNEMVYTYNQGVILSGQRGLFTITKNVSYLEDGYGLIENVIRATGYEFGKGPVDDLSALPPGCLPPWHGLGRAGILEDVCDARGDCSQDAQTFKGIFFHHLTAFCAPLDISSSQMRDDKKLHDTKRWHEVKCQSFLGWIKRNALAALRTRDANGTFGMWWTAGTLNLTMNTLQFGEENVGSPDPRAVDYRNVGVPNDPVWTDNIKPPTRTDVLEQQLLSRRRRATFVDRGTDPNDRGRGRTVETQGGALAVLRCYSTLSS